MKSGVKDSQGGLPMPLATIRIIVQSAKKEGKFSTIVCGSVHVAQKTLVVLVVQKVFKSRLVKKVFFFTLLYDPLLQLLGFHLLLRFSTFQFSENILQHLLIYTHT